MINQLQIIDKKSFNFSNETFFAIDILRILLAFIILNFHILYNFYLTTKQIKVGGGYLAVLPFFMISGFFYFFTNKKKNNPYTIRIWFKKILIQLPLILLSLIISIFLCFVLLLFKIKDFTFQPFFDTNGGFWYVFILWHVEFIVLFVCRSKPKTEKILITSITIFCCFIYIGYSALEMYWKQAPRFLLSILSGFEHIARGMFGFGIGALIYYLYTKAKNVYLSNWLKVLFTIIVLLTIPPICYFMFYKYDKLIRLVSVLLFAVQLAILFCKFDYISSKIKISQIASKFCRKYSMILYFYHLPIASFMPIVLRNNLKFEMYAFLTLIIVILYSVLFYFVAPMIQDSIIHSITVCIQNRKIKKTK